MPKNATIKRPFIFSNLAITIDGKIAPASREEVFLGSKADHQQMQVLRRKSDAILMGSSTLRAYNKPLLVRGKNRSSPLPKKQPLNVVISRHLDNVNPRSAFFTEPTTRRILFTLDTISKKRLDVFSSIPSTEVISFSDVTAGKVVASLVQLGFSRLLVEGGGEIMWMFIKENLLDELNVTIVPKILGGKDAPTLVEGEGFTLKTLKTFKLKKCTRIKDELFLVYKKDPKKK